MENNLQKQCAKMGFQLVNQCQDNKELKNMLSKILGILRENGIYSFFIWLEERGARKDGMQIIARTIYFQCIVLLVTVELFKFPKIKSEVNNFDNRNISNWEEWQSIIDLCMQSFVFEDNYNPDKLYLISKIFEQYLTYAFYKAKAVDKNF